jgi:hypothetical protein
MATAAGPGPSSSPSDGRQQVLADHQLQTVQKEEQQSEQLLQLPNQILELTKTIHTVNLARSPAGQDGT